MVAGFLVVRMIAPEIFGAFSGVSIFLGYVLLGHFGIINGLGRDIPYELGKKNSKLVSQLAGLGLWISYFIGVIAFLVFSVFLLDKIKYGSEQDILIYTTFTAISFFYVLTKAYLPVLFRTNNEFDKLSKIYVTLACINIASVLLVWKFSFYGLCARALLLIIIEFSLLFYFRPIKVKPSWNFCLAKSELKTGVPIYAVGQIKPLWATVQNNIIFSLGGPLQFGYFAIANIVYGALRVIPTSISQIIYPKMSIQFGEGKSTKAIIRSAIWPTIFQFIIILIVALVTFFVLPIAVPLALPKYLGGVEAAMWSVFIPVITSLGLVNNIYNVVKKQRWYFISIISGTVTGLGYSIFRVLSEGFNLVFFPQGMIIGGLIQIFLSIVFLKKIHES